MKFAILLEKCAGPEEFQAVVPDHVAYLQRLHEQGRLIAAGPFRDGGGGLILLDAEDEAAAHALASADPFIVRGVERYTLRSWDILSAVKPDLLTRDG